MSAMRTTRFTFAAGILLALSCPPASAQRSAPRGPINEIGVDQHLDTLVPPDLLFTDAEGRSKTLGSLLSTRPALLVPVYYECPMLCGEALRGLLGALKALNLDVGNDFDVIVLSFNPAEGPEQAAQKRREILESYGERGDASGWHFLSGEAPAISPLMETIGFRYVYDGESGQFAHASIVVVLTPEGRIARYFFGIDYPPRELRLALVEASQGRIGSVVDQFLLYCYHYDPTTGRYGVVIMNVLRLGGGLTVALLLGFMVRGFLSDRRANRPTAGGRSEPGTTPASGSPGHR